MTEPELVGQGDRANTRQRRLLLAILLAVLAGVWLVVGLIVLFSLAGALVAWSGSAPEPLGSETLEEPERAAYGLLQSGSDRRPAPDAWESVPSPTEPWPAPTPTATPTAMSTAVDTDTNERRGDSEADAEASEPSLDLPSELSEPTLVPPVDWPKMPEFDERVPITTTTHFEVFAVAPDATVDDDLAARWGSELEAIHDRVGAAIGVELPTVPVKVAFATPYPARCPARGLASMGSDPIILVYADADTPDFQIRGVLAHEIVHQMTFGEPFVGDGVLTEGIANWGAGRMMLEWQGYSDWDAAVLDYLDDGSFVPVSDMDGLSPGSDEDCIERRDRVYNSRAAFVGWLVGKIGIETVLSMPRIEVPVRDPESGEVQIDSETGEVVTVQRPDYKAATGYDLETLEMIWLMELWTSR